MFVGFRALRFWICAFSGDVAQREVRKILDALDGETVMSP